ncbi:hypothetical protein ACG2F4_17835 [Halalkalibaculum sp. DA3122]|uniref:hypothetical protein n=1 Tax=Halalkalibaculum sp. DA3122 TaxID=3373607 RepID=UPI003753F171
MNLQTDGKFHIKWGELHTEILSDFIQELNKAEIRYFILRNYEGLPKQNNAKDVDIIIDCGTYDKAASILRSIFQKKNISNFHVVKYERVRCWFGINVENNFSIHIDLIEGYLSKGFEIFSFDILYQNTKAHKNFRVLNEPYNALMLLYYKLIGANYLKKKYQDKINSIYSRYADCINNKIINTAGEKLGKEIISSLENEKFSRIENMASLLSKETKKRAFLRKPYKTLVNIFKFLAEKFYRIVICPRKFQKFISVHGPDGSGKSTFINGLTESIEYYFLAETKTHVYHHRPTILPNLGAVGHKAGLKKQDKNFTNPHRAEPAGQVNSFLRMGYYWLDYLIGVPLKIRKDVQFDRFTIYDRYIYDFLIDPHRSRINLSYWVRKIFTRLVPHPQISFVLLTDAETVYERKQELSLEEIERQLKEFKKLADTNDRFIVMDASKPPEDLVEEATEIIIERFTKKV